VAEKVIKINKYARFNYTVDKEYEAGIVLSGADVKQIRGNTFEVQDAFVRAENGELFIWNVVFYDQQKDNTVQRRKLLLHRSEIDKITNLLKDKKQHGFVLRVRYNEKNKVKLDLGFGVTKKKQDKKQDQKRSSNKRTLERTMKTEYGV
jgi:SsrA-binding protein